MTTLTASPMAARAERDWDSLQFRFIFAMCLPVCLCAGLGKRLSPDFWRGPAASRSLFAEAWKGAGTTARIALAG